ncbi:MAG: LamG-like jellyroll fold domain-containing protein, partial [Planctomycetota bacterium]
WIQYEFDTVYKLYELHVWNHNTSLETALGFGIKDATVEYSIDGANWNTVGTAHEFTQASGGAGYAANTIVDLSGVAAKYVKITANSNWGSFPQYGLSEVRFLYLPVLARELDPAPGATDIDVDNAVLSWRAGREVVRHDVYLGTDQQAVIDETVSPAGVPADGSYASYSTGPLDLAQTYYWKVNEVNEAQTPATWQGDVSNFSTCEFLLVEDFELYNDLDPTDPNSNRIFFTWIDGLDLPTNGSVVGYAEAPFCEQTIVHDGKQSMPLSYDNTGGATYSEATHTFAAGQDWTKHNIRTLGLWFHGTAGNTGQLYLKVNGIKILYDGDATNLAILAWQPWNIDLIALGTDLQNITTLTIGIDGNGATGTLLVDDIRLYAYERQLATPVEPDPVNLAGHWQFDGNLNDRSGSSRHGAAVGGPVFIAGKSGQAIELDGVDDYVTITGYKGVLADAGGVQQPFTLTAWVKTTDSGDRTIASWGTNSSKLRVDFRLFEGRLRVEHGSGNRQGDTTLNDGNWHHVALIMNQGATVSHPDVQLWLDGQDNTRAGADPDEFSITADVDMAIGCRVTAPARYFLGAIDDVRLYDRVLSQEEMVWLAGKTLPYDKPF